MVKISLLKARIIKKLVDLPKPARNGSQLAKEFLIGRNYLYENLRDLRDWGLLSEIERGRKKFYNPSVRAVELANKKISAEIAKNSAEFEKKQAEVRQ